MLIVKGMHLINLHFWTYLSLSRAAGLKYRSQVTGHRSQVTMKNTCKFAASSYLVGICLFRPFLT